MRVLGMKMTVKNIVLLVLAVLGVLSVLNMLGIRTPRVEFMGDGHDDDGHGDSDNHGKKKKSHY